jgi:hypothetical protein
MFVKLLQELQRLLVIRKAGRAMAQAVSRRLLTAEARICTWVISCGICSGQSDTGTGFSPSSEVSPVRMIPPWLFVLIVLSGV